MLGHEKRLNRIITFSKNMTDNNSAYPHTPDSIFDVITPSLLWSLIRKLGKAFAHSAGRTEKTAPETTEEYAQNEHQRKNNKASINDMLQSRHDNKVRRKIINRNWKKQHADDKRKLSDFLQSHNLPPVIPHLENAKYTWYNSDYIHAK